MKKDFIYISLILVFVFFTVRNNFDIKLKSHDSVKVDSVKVVKEIPESKGEFKIIQPKPTVINNYISNDKQLKNIINQLEKKYNQKADSITILRELLQAKKVRQYTEVVEDSLIKGTIKAETVGTLNSIDFKYTKKPQKITYHEKTITKKLTPKFSLLVGGRLSTNNTFNNSSLELNIGTQFKNMDILEIGYDTNNSWSVGYKFNAFTKY